MLLFSFRAITPWCEKSPGLCGLYVTCDALQNPLHTKNKQKIENRQHGTTSLFHTAKEALQNPELIKSSEDDMLPSLEEPLVDDPISPQDQGEIDPFEADEYDEDPFEAENEHDLLEESFTPFSDRTSKGGELRTPDSFIDSSFLSAKSLLLADQQLTVPRKLSKLEIVFPPFSYMMVLIAVVLFFMHYSEELSFLIPSGL